MPGEAGHSLPQCHSFLELCLPAQGEVARAVRMAIWSYTPGAEFTKACDAVVTSLCPASATPRKWGAVGKCLKTNMDQDLQNIPAECRSLLDIGLPKDARKDFVSTLTLAGLHSHMRTTEKALGFKRGTLVERKRGVRRITLTGWSALIGVASLIVVLLGGVYALYYQNRYGRLPDIDAAASGPMVLKTARK